MLSGSASGRSLSGRWRADSGGDLLNVSPTPLPAPAVRPRPRLLAVVRSGRSREAKSALLPSRTRTPASVRYARYLDDMVVLAADTSKGRQWADRALVRIRQEAEVIGVSLNAEKTRLVTITEPGASFAFLGFEFRWERARRLEDGIRAEPRDRRRSLRSYRKLWPHSCQRRIHRHAVQVASVEVWRSTLKSPLGCVPGCSPTLRVARLRAENRSGQAGCHTPGGSRARRRTYPYSCRCRWAARGRDGRAPMFCGPTRSHGCTHAQVEQEQAPGLDVGKNKRVLFRERPTHTSGKPPGLPLERYPRDIDAYGWSGGPEIARRRPVGYLGRICGGGGQCGETREQDESGRHV